MFGKIAALLAVPLAFVAYSSLAKASPKTGPTFDVKGKSGTNWRVVRVNQFQEKSGLLTINDVMAGGALSIGGSPRRVLRYSQLGSEMGSRKYITSPFEAGNLSGSDATLLRMAASDFGVALPAPLMAKIRAQGG